MTMKTPTKSGLFQSCNNISQCTSDLVCDQGFCKRPINGPCSNLIECAQPANVCDGTCKVGETGGLNQFCPCDPGLVPVTTTDRCVCKGGADFACSSDFDCQSGNCDSGFCSAAKQAGFSCSMGQCDSGLYCSSGFCQSLGPPPVVTGQPGATCFPGSDFPPLLGQETAGCIPGASCLNNTCVVMNAHLGSKCVDVCNDPLVCTNGICTFQNNPNKCLDGACIPNFECIDDNCLAKDNQSCTNDASCVDTCVSIPEIMSWKLSTSFNKVGWKPNVSPGTVERIESDNWALSDEGLFRKIGINWHQVLDKTFTSNGVEYTIIDFSLFSGNPKIVVKSIESLGVMWKAVFNVEITSDGSGMITPFNTTDLAKPGAQFDKTGDMLDIISIDFTEKGPDIAIESKGGIYLKKSGETLYVFQRHGKKPRFYQGKKKFLKAYDDFENYAYVQTEVKMGITNSLVNFSGQLHGLCLPQELQSGLNRLYNIVDYAIYSDRFSGIRGGAIYIVAEIVSGGSGFVVFVVKKKQLQLAGYFNETSRVSATGSDLFITTGRSCQSILN